MKTCLSLDQGRAETLYYNYDMYGLPRLLVLSSLCEKITSDGANEFLAAPKEAIRRWLQGKRLFWSREPSQGEHVWERAFCYQCYISPLIGTRYSCIHRECQVNVCETCLSKYKHEHQLVEYLTPKQHYSLEQLFRSVPYLLNPTNDEKIETKTMWEEGVKSIGFYFSAHWCQPCCEFTPKLAELYKEAQASSDSFRIAFVSSDNDEELFNEYRSTMPWPAVPLDSGILLNAYFQNTSTYIFNLLIFHKMIIILFAKGIPELYIVSSCEKLLSRRGHSDVLRKGIEALKTWAQGENWLLLPQMSFYGLKPNARVATWILLLVKDIVV
jgi:thiol-disulfide isomerase/thioredoxin